MKPLKKRELKMKRAFLKKLKVLESLKLPKEEYLIWGSGPLAIRELRSANDVDVVVSKKLWEELSKKYPPEGEKKNLIRIGVIDIWKDCLNLTDKIDEMLKNRDEIEGYSFMSLEDTIEWKKFYGRQKDRDDIALIEKFLSSGSIENIKTVKHLI